MFCIFTVLVVAQSFCGISTEKCIHLNIFKQMRWGSLTYSLFDILNQLSSTEIQNHFFRGVFALEGTLLYMLLVVVET